MEKQTKNNKSAASKSGNASPKKNSGAKKSSLAEANGTQETPMLEKFIVDSLKDIYYAEKQLLKALPKMNKAATTPELKQAFQKHTTVTQEQIARLDQVFEMMGKRAQGKKCEAMEGLIKESESAIEDTEAGSKTRDVALIMAAQKVEHYEIASYGGLVQITKTMGKQEVSDLLAQTLAEEKETDQLLTDIAENNINLQAQEEGGSEVEEGETEE
ncbi:MAG: ferritin-like domain-containing protein [Chitinophagaceae bacterium]